MVNQLWASRQSGAKKFESGDGVRFGWDAIVNLWNREKEKRDSNQIRLVPGLLESYVERDAWTKLNVKPAKIMQVCAYWYCQNVAACACQSRLLVL
jgi:hypothetical protein